MTAHVTVAVALAATMITPMAAAAQGAASPALSCESLSSLALANTKITLAQTVADGAFVPPGAGGGNAAARAYAALPSFCRVAATLTPSGDSDIKIEVWLPASGLNGKFEAVGNGGWAGTIAYPAMAAALSAGYATVSTDTGHTGNSADFALGHPEKLIDLGYRSIHEMTVTAKSIINARYGNAPRLSYFNGCSQGGRQGITEAQRYPADFNGIVAGAPVWNGMRLHASRTALNLAVNKSADSVVKTVGNAASANSIALFMVPGMNHCQGGPGTDTFDKMGVIEEWVERGKTPTRIVASHLTNGKVDRTRPLCPFGQVAQWKGTGSTDDAAKFSCVGEPMDTVSAGR